METARLRGGGMERVRSDARGGFCMGAKLMLEIMLEGPGMKIE